MSEVAKIFWIITIVCSIVALVFSKTILGNPDNIAQEAIRPIIIVIIPYCIASAVSELKNLMG